MSAEFTLTPDGIYRSHGLLEFDFANHGFGSRLANPPSDITLRQIHSNLVWNAQGLSDREQEGDALISNVIGKSIGIRTADCVPILLLDPETHAVAAVHAGWRGTAAGILGRTVQRLKDDFGVQPSHLRAAIGPSIQKCCYQVGPEVSREFVSIFPEWSGEPGQIYLDLPEANRRQLLAAGLPQSQIFHINLCTFCLPETLFSFRREPGNPGRMIAAISRVS